MSSTSEMTARRYLDTLKEMLRERRVTYAELADALHCSLPTVKRAINKPFMPLSRLLEICEIAGISFEHLCRRAEKRRPEHYVFNDRQDRLFSEREELLRYLVELAREGATPSVIAEQHDLDRRSTDLYLRHLARVGLIERQGRGGVRLLAKPPFGFGPGSRVLQREHEAFLRSVVAEVIAGDPGKKGCVAVLKPLQLAEEDYRQMIGELKAVIDRFAAIGERDLAAGSGSSWQVALACGPGGKAETRKLPRIKS